MQSTTETNGHEGWICELQAPLFRYAVSLGLSSHDAEDAVQEGLIALARALDKHPDSIQNPKAYAFTSIRNNANKRFRERSRRKEIEMSDDHPAQEASEEPFENPVLVESFRQAFDKLSSTECRLLQQYYVERWTYEQIGSELGCSAQNAWKTIKKIVSQILAGELRNALTKADPELARELYRH